MTPLERARAWADADPDPDAAARLRAAIDDDPDGVEADFSSRLEFGTAGIRGPLGVGPRRMNRVLVRAVAAAVARRVLADAPPADAPAAAPVDAPVDGKDDASRRAPLVVVAYDARHHSNEFALDSARVFAAHGLRTVMFDGVAPTPLVPFAVTRLGARAGVVVTASHNPAADSGYKVYWHDGAQIIGPTDAEISAEIDAVGLVTDADLGPADDPLIRTDDGTLREAYLAMATSLVGAPEAPLTLVYTPVHGVGGATLLAALKQVGHARPHVVEAQALPDPDFATAPFPNPEEPGVLDLAFALAAEVKADLVLANDPDADRLAVGVPDTGASQRPGSVPDDQGWRRLTGDDVGALLGDHLLTMAEAHGVGAPHERLVVTTIVSSRMLSRIAAAHGARHATTLTGFKWIVRPGFADPDARFVFGYEEALGYACTPAVPDKDGITAALVIADLAAALAARGHTLVDRLHELAARHGVHRTGQRSVRVDTTTTTDPVAQMASLMAALRATTPDEIGGRAVVGATDHLRHTDPAMRTDAVGFDLDDGSRLVVRPSGTEPKVKLYAEVVTECGADAARSFADADAAVAALLQIAPDRLGLTKEHDR